MALQDLQVYKVLYYECKRKWLRKFMKESGRCLITRTIKTFYDGIEERHGKHHLRWRGFRPAVQIVISRVKVESLLLESDCDGWKRNAQWTENITYFIIICKLKHVLSYNSIYAYSIIDERFAFYKSAVE